MYEATDEERKNCEEIIKLIFKIDDDIMQKIQLMKYFKQHIQLEIAQLLFKNYENLKFVVTWYIVSDRHTRKKISKRDIRYRYVK